jgi:hypothetical protein
MGKKLIDCNCLDQYICRKKKRIYLDPSLVLSPGAKDELVRRGVEIVYSSNPDKQGKTAVREQAKETEAELGSDDKVLVKKIVRLLSSEYGVKDREQLIAISMQALDTLRPKH